MLIPLIFGAILLASGDGFLLEHQRRLEELNGQMVQLLSSSHRANSEMIRNFIETDILVYLGNATVQLQTVYVDVTNKMKQLRDDPLADHRCLDTIDASIYDEVLTGQFWLQVCVGGVDFFLTRDPVVRFRPVAITVQRDATRVLQVIVEQLGLLNAALDGGEQLREQLDWHVDYFEGVSERAERDLAEELEKHEDAREDIVESFQECVESLYYYFQVQLYNLLGFARDTCLSESEAK